jgi:O-acetylserine/cysteine efflux transporter
MKPWETGLAVLVSFVWGLSFVAIKIGVNTFPPLLFSALRFTLAAIPLVFFLTRPKVSWRLIIGIGFVLGVVKFSLLFLGMSVGLSAGLASLTVQVQVFFTVILAAVLLGDRPSHWEMLGIILAFCGIAAVATTIDTSATKLGFALVLLAALAWAVTNILMSRAGQVQMLNLMVWISLVPPVPLVVLSLLFESQSWPALSEIRWDGILALFYVTFVGTVLGFAGWGFLIARQGAGRVAPFGLLVPIAGMASSAVILGESFGPVRLFGAILIGAGLCLVILKKTDAKP